jgi:F-type H+-transporting ATPase subunit epsilon
MMPAAMKLEISTPLEIVVEAQDVASFRAADASGDFGIMPGHVDMLAVLETSVVRWWAATGSWHFCALRGGVLAVENGDTIRIACRTAITGDDLSRLEREVREYREAETDAARRARVAQTRLHAQAIRQIMRHIADGTASEAAELEGLMQ